MLKVTTLALWAAVTAAQRTTVSLDLGWRVAPEAPGACNFTDSYDDMVVVSPNNHLVANFTGDAAACAALACAGNVRIFSFCAGAASGCGALACALDSGGQMTNYGAGGWVTRARPVAGPPALAPEAQPGFVDTAWRVVDLPHDASAEGAYRPTSDGPEAFIPPVATYYRKHFAVPAAWEHTAVTLVVDGALAASTWWLNGVQVVALNTAGYLPTVLRLDVVGPLNYGGPNVSSSAHPHLGIWTLHPLPPS